MISCLYFHFRNEQITFVSKVMRVQKANTVATNQSTGLKFPIWTDRKICPGYWTSMVIGLIWRGPKLVGLSSNWHKLENSRESKNQRKKGEASCSCLPCPILLSLLLLSPSLKGLLFSGSFCQFWVLDCGYIRINFIWWFTFEKILCSCRKS